MHYETSELGVGGSPWTMGDGRTGPTLPDLGTGATWDPTRRDDPCGRGTVGRVSVRYRDGRSSRVRSFRSHTVQKSETRSKSLRVSESVTGQDRSRIRLPPPCLPGLGQTTLSVSTGTRPHYPLLVYRDWVRLPPPCLLRD